MLVIIEKKKSNLYFQKQTTHSRQDRSDFNVSHQLLQMQNQKEVKGKINLITKVSIEKTKRTIAFTREVLANNMQYPI